jgi:hypothetical protein
LPEPAATALAVAIAAASVSVTLRRLGIDALGTDTVAIAKAAEERRVGTASRNVAVDTATEGGGSIKEIRRELLRERDTLLQTAGWLCRRLC